MFQQLTVSPEVQSTSSALLDSVQNYNKRTKQTKNKRNALFQYLRVGEKRIPDRNALLHINKVISRESVWTFHLALSSAFKEIKRTRVSVMWVNVGHKYIFRGHPNRTCYILSNIATFFKILNNFFSAWHQENKSCSKCQQ